jgi:sec-independent protein translocase protein TatA
MVTSKKLLILLPEKQNQKTNKKMNLSLLFIFGGAFGPTEIILVILALLLLFGGRKIPELMRGLGTGIKEFKNASKSDEENKPPVPPANQNPPSSPTA